MRTFWLLPLLVALQTGSIAAMANTNGDQAVWQLQIKDGHILGCQTSCIHIDAEAKGQTLLSGDSRHDNTTWHSCISVPPGLLRKGQDYLISVDYEIIDSLNPDCYFYAFGRSEKLGYGADQWQRWSGHPGDKGIAKLRLTPRSDDFGITVGIHNKGAIRYKNIKIIEGTGWTTIPVQLNDGSNKSEAPPVGPTAFEIETPATTNGPVLNLADFGAVADGNAPPTDGPDRNLAAFKAAALKCQESKATKLIVPKGVYRITSAESILFQDLKDFTFDGGGSTFLFHKIKGGAGFRIKDCQRTVFSNFNIDWDWQVEPLASIGRVKAVSEDKSYFEMRFEGKAPTETRQWLTMNPLDEKLRVPGEGQEVGALQPKKIESLDEQTVRVWPAYKLTLPLGKLYLLRHYDYNKLGLSMESCAHLTLKDVTIFSFPGIGFMVGGDQHHYQLLHCRITHPGEKRRPITTTADGFHVNQSKGFLKLEDCDFGYMGDDCVNIHDNIHAGARRDDARTLVATNLENWKCPFAEGDTVEIRHGDYSPTGFKAKVISLHDDYKLHEVIMNMDRDLPDKIDNDAVLLDHRFGTDNYIIRNCYFHENRARGVLCNTPDGLVEGNRFFHNQHSAMLIVTDLSPHWSEGFGVHNLIVRNNSFKAMNTMGAVQGAAVYMDVDINGKSSPYPLMQNILFENNTFQDMTGPAIWAKSFKNLSINKNNFDLTSSRPNSAKNTGSIMAEMGSGLWLNGNTWQKGASGLNPSLLYDPDSTHNVGCHDNRLQ